MQDYIGVNRELWDERAPARAASADVSPVIDANSLGDGRNRPAPTRLAGALRQIRKELRRLAEFT